MCIARRRIPLLSSPCSRRPVFVRFSRQSEHTTLRVSPFPFGHTLSVVFLSPRSLCWVSPVVLCRTSLVALSVGYLMPLPVKHRLSLSLSVISCHSLLVDPSMSSTTGPSPLPRSWLVLFCSRLLPAPISRCPIRHVLSFLVGSFRRLVHLNGLTVCSRLK